MRGSTARILFAGNWFENLMLAKGGLSITKTIL